jgi:type I restriction enzyme, S subunit
MTTTGGHWSTGPLGDFLTFQRGFDITKEQQSSGPYPVYSSSGPGSTHVEFKVHGPGVIIGRKGSLGTVFFEEGPYWPHDTTLWVKDFRGNDPRFIYYALQTLNLEKYDVGASNPTLNRNHLHLIPVSWPCLETQVRIAGTLAAYDALIENNRSRLRLLEEMSLALHRAWFIERAARGGFGASLPGPSIGWKRVPLRDAVEINPKVAVPRDGEKPFVPMGCLSNDSMIIEGVASRTGNSGAKFQNGDTLFARITPCLENGKTGFVQFLPDAESVAFGSTEFIVLRSRTLTPEFVYLLSRSDDVREPAIKSMSGASGRQRVQERCFDMMTVVQPPPSVLERFTEIVRPMFRLAHQLHLQNGNLRRTRDLLLPRLMSGQLSIPDPNDQSLVPSAPESATL